MAGERVATSNEQQVSTHVDQDSDESAVRLTQYSVLRSPATLPRPTYWPVVMAAGIVFMTWGIATTLAITAVGLALFALSLGGWIGEWRHGH